MSDDAWDTIFEYCKCGAPKLIDSPTCLRLECEIGTKYENDLWDDAFSEK